MFFSRKEQWLIFCSVNGLLISAVLLYPLYDKYLAGTPFNRCTLLDVFRLYCPACGGTRAFAALLDFDIIASFKYNPIVPLGAAVLIAYEFAMIKHLIRGGKREVFVKPWMPITFVAIWFAYSIVRDVLLFYGIDLLGNVLTR